VAALAGFAFLLLGAIPVHAEYELGRGLPLFDGRLIVGGYLAINATFLDETPDRLLVDDLSTFLTLKLTDTTLIFAEAELEDPVHIGKGGVGSGSNIFSLERLYAQWEPGDHFRLRVGKLLTPIGIWNTIHAAPLVWTTSRPIATRQFFDTGVTGAEATVFSTLRSVDVAFTAFGQATPHLDDPNDDQQNRYAFGTHLEAGAQNGPHLGASFVRFDDDTDHRWETTYAADAMWSMRLVEFSLEVAANDPDSGLTTWGAYFQSVFHVGSDHQFHPFVRVEYADLGAVRRVPVVFGLAWKPVPAMVFKLEGIVGGDDTELGGDGALTSFAVLF